MLLNVSALFREDAILFDRTLPPGPANPGGGLAEKLHNLTLALPRINTTHLIGNCKDIVITESLWFSGQQATFERVAERIQAYSDLQAFKILWTSDLECLRWRGDERKAIFEATDVICGNSQYMVDILKVYAPCHKVTLLTDCVDPNSIIPLQKKRQIIGMSNVIIEKNIDAVISIYKELKSNGIELERGYVGSSKVWGLPIRDTESKKLEMGLTDVCDWVVPQATRNEVFQISGVSWGFVVDSGFDTFCYALIEAMLAGCWTFCGKHHIYDPLPVERFDNTEEAILKIMEKASEEDISVNQEGRQYVIDNFSLDVFRRQFIQIVGRSFL